MPSARFMLTSLVVVSLMIQTLAYPVAESTSTFSESCLSQSPPVDFEGSWYSADNTSARRLTSNSFLEGDRVSLVGVFHYENLTEQVTKASCRLALGVFVELVGELVPRNTSTWPVGLILTDFAWCYAAGIKNGDTVRVTLDFSNEDCDMMAWWADTDNTTWTFTSNLLGGQATTNATPEFASFTADRDGTIAIGVYDYANTEGNYAVTVDTRVGVGTEEADGNTVTLNTTDYLTHNMNLAVVFIGYLSNGSVRRIDHDNVTIVNYFAPEVLDVLVTGQGSLRMIHWTIHDRNALETHGCEVLLSSDGGASYQLLADDLSSTEYTWDSTGFWELEYQVMVRVSDSHGDTGVGVSGPFAAGTVHHTVIPTTITLTDTTTDSLNEVVMTQASIMVTLASALVILAVLIQWWRGKIAIVDTY